MSRETTSFPTPVSPVIRTFASERAAQSMSARRSWMPSLSPIKRTSSDRVGTNKAELLESDKKVAMVAVIFSSVNVQSRTLKNYVRQPCTNGAEIKDL